MPNIETAVNFAIAQSGKPYSTSAGRFGMHHFDCSGLVIRALDEAGVSLPNGISVEREWGNTVSVWYWARDVGGLVSVDKAMRTRGAILLKGRWWGNGPLGHIEFSLGDGREVGAHSTRSGIGVRQADASRYHDGVIFPGVNYGPVVPPVDPRALARIVAIDQWRNRVKAKPLRFGDRGTDVAMLIQLLRELHFLHWYTTGTAYGITLRTGVVKFKNTVPHLANQPAPAKGETFGGDAADALVARVV